MNTESQTERITQLEAALSEEKRIVDRVWNALGISTYEQAKPLAIDEHVKSLLDRLQAVEKERNELVSSHQICVGAAGIGDFSELCGWIDGIKRDRDRYKAALEKLAVLGNEPMPGNSIGNRIAQEALQPAKEQQ